MARSSVFVGGLLSGGGSGAAVGVPSASNVISPPPPPSSRPRAPDDRIAITLTLRAMPNPSCQYLPRRISSSWVERADPRSTHPARVPKSSAPLVHLVKVPSCLGNSRARRLAIGRVPTDAATRSRSRFFTGEERYLMHSRRSCSPRLIWVSILLGALIGGAACTENPVGRKCFIGADAGSSTEAIVASPALECPSRTCLHYPQEQGATDRKSVV